MGAMKELFMAAQERMAEEYLELHPDATDEEVQEYLDKQSTCDEAMQRAAEGEI